MKFDKTFLNGNIYTMESEGSHVEALGIKDGVIAFTGSNSEAALYESDQIIDLQGKTVIPGMADSHLHMYAYCQNQTSVDLAGVKSIEEMVKMMSSKAEVVEKGKWIKGVNFDQTKWKENRFPTRRDLDLISKDHPIVIRRCCLHALVANTKALELAGVGAGYDGGPGGIVEFEEDGTPNGIIREQSTKVFDEIIPDPLQDPEERERIMTEVLADMSEKGITTIHTYAAKIWRYNEDIEAYKSLDKERRLPVRITVCIDELFEPEILTEAQKQDPYRLVQYGAYKIFSDGSLGSRSAALREPYADDPDNVGFVVCDQETLTNKVTAGYEKGLQPAIHAIGDRALDMTLTAIEKTLETARKNGMKPAQMAARLPFRIIHVQMVDESLVERMKQLPLVLDIQPIFLCTDLHWVGERIGKEREKGTYAWKTLQNAGMILTGGSDCPVETYDPIKGIYAAVTRKDFDGYPPCGYHPEEKLSVYEAFCAYTKNVHYATGQQEVLGTLVCGKFADLAVLDRNPFAISEDELKDIVVEQTFVAGRQVFVRK